jgi:hypothetical protein
MGRNKVQRGIPLIEQIKIAYRYLFVMGAGALLLFLATLVPVISTTTDFSIYNTGWNGCSGLGRDVYATGSFLPTIDISSSSEERVSHNTLSEMRGKLDPEMSAIIIIGPSKGFSDDERDFIHDFMVSGGVVLLSDDFGSGNSLLSELNTTTRISPEMMLDLSFMKKAEFAVTNDIAADPLTSGVNAILMNYPAVIHPAPYATVLINSSSSSWLESNENLRQDADEEIGPFAIFTKESYGRGELLVLSEPSLLINQMKSKLDNGILVQDIISYLSANRTTLLIDESHRDPTDPVHFMNDFVSGMEVPYKITVLTILLGAFVLLQTPAPRYLLNAVRKGIDRLMKEPATTAPSIDSTIASVMNDHPDWNERVLRQLVKDAEG